MKTQITPDIGEEIIMKLEDLLHRINKLIEEKNEKEFPDPHSHRDRD